MGDQLHAVEGILLGVELLEEHQTVVELDGTRVLLTEQLEVGQDGKAILLEGAGDACIAFHPLEGTADLIEELVELGHLVGIAVTEEHTDRMAVAYGGLLVELTCYERIEEGGQRTAGVADHGLPA